MKKIISSISPENPLKDFPYWNSPDGKNLDSIACLEWLEAYIIQMDKELPCAENKESLWHIQRALKIQKDRIQIRKDQGVLGTNNPHVSNIKTLDDIG